MAEKELPPLRVRIIGDDSHLRKTIKDLIKDAEKFGKDLSKTTQKANAETSQATRQTSRESSRSINRDMESVNKWIKSIKSKVKDIHKGGKRDWDKLIAGVDAQVRANEKAVSDRRKQADAEAARREREADNRLKARRKEIDAIAEKRSKEADDRQKQRQKEIIRVRKEADKLAEERSKAADARFVERQKVRQRESYNQMHGPNLKQIRDALAYQKQVQAGLASMHGPSREEILARERYARQLADERMRRESYNQMHGPNLKQIRVAQAYQRQVQAGLAAMHGPSRTQIQAAQQYQQQQRQLQSGLAAMHGPSRAQIQVAQAYQKQVQAGLAAMHGPNLQQLQAAQRYHNAQQQSQQNAQYLRRLRFNSRVMEDQRRLAEREAQRQQRRQERLARNQIRILNQEDRQRHRQRMDMARQLGAFQRSMETRRSARPDMGFGLGARADIYMHMNALRNLSQSGKGLIELAGGFEQSQIAIEAFTGSADTAASVMKEIQDYAIASPYQTVQIAEMARNMMSYGVAADQTMTTIKALGDIAGGSGLRLERLSFAMSQITSMGRLQGQELRQLTEQGFNPLRTISEHTGRKMSELTDIMQKGGVSAKAVAEALKVETSAGGRFAGMAARMQQSLVGLINQVKELGQKLGLTVIKAVEQDLKNALMIAIEKLKIFIAYIETPEGKAAVKRFADIALQVMKAAFAFHIIGLAIATVRWQIASLATILSVLKGALIPVHMLFTMALGPILLMTQAIQALLTGSVVGFVGFLGSLAQTVIGLGALGVGVAAARDLVSGSGSLTEAFKNLPAYIKTASNFISGFFYNIEANWKVLFEWVTANYDMILQHLHQSTTAVVAAIGNNIMVIGNFLVDAFMIGIDWLDANMPMIIDRLLATAKAAAKSVGKGIIQSKGVQSVLNEALYIALGPVGSQLRRMDQSKFGESIGIGDISPFGLAATLSGKKPEDGNAVSTRFSEAANKLIQNLQHGFEDGSPFPKDAMTSLINKLKLDLPKLIIPEPPDIVIPEKHIPDFSDLGKGMSAVKSFKLTDAAMYQSADHAKRIYEYERNMEAIQAGLRGEPQQENIDKQQLKALQGIEKNTRPAAAPAAANFSPT